ncbi:type II secretion system protein G [Pelomonas sp. Root1237]|nr:prepilin-type N-terminal cleavage/methylation domain-containing protein [Pelomonas sp. Root1237]KQV95041.1 type II secretion system protein G [Pelomonas sp. Root1237]
MGVAKHRRGKAKVVIGRHGFTVIELLVVLAVMALLLSVAAPRYVQHVDRARETTLRHDLYAMRDAIDKFCADQGRYPKDLSELVQRRYLRDIPVDPLTERRDTWTVVPGRTGSAVEDGVADVHSGARATALDGSSYASW